MKADDNVLLPLSRGRKRRRRRRRRRRRKRRWIKDEGG